MHRVGIRVSACLLFILFFAALPSSAETMALHLRFEALHQSMWGRGAAAPPTATTFKIIDPDKVTWDFKAPSDYPNYAGSFFSADTYLFGTADFGAGGRAATNGKIGLTTTFTLANPGSIDVTYPVAPTLVFPDQNSFRAGDTVEIKTSYVSEDGWQLASTSPQFKLTLDGTFRLFAQADARFCIFDCFTTDDLLPSSLKPEINIGSDTPFNIFTVAADCNGVPNCHNGIATPSWFGLITGSPLTGDMHVPNIRTTGIREANDRSLLSTGTDNFINAQLDVAGIAAAAVGVPIPLEFNSDDASSLVDLKGFSFHYTLLHGALNASLNALQRFHFDPTLKVNFAFGVPMEHWVGSGAHTTSATAEINVGDNLSVKYPSDLKQPTAITPTFTLPNTFQSTTRFTVGSDFDVAALALGGHTPEIEVFPRLCTPAFCTPEVSVAGVTIIPEICVPEICTPAVTIPAVTIADIGPVYHQDFPILTNSPLGPPLFDSSWEIPFDSKDTNSFNLDPENPIINLHKQMTSTVNLGSGKRRVNYVLDVSNPGDVNLNSLDLTDNLAAAFAGARGFKVEQVIGCNLAADNTFDGKTNLNMLASGNTIAPGATKRFFVIVTVAPQPDPAPYVNTSTTDGTSALGTLVTKSDSASVTLGAAPVRSIDDLVLFGDHFLKLEAIGDSFGSMGSNEFLEVKNGASGVVAGDLRSNREIRVEGTILADYAISSGQVNVVGKAALTLTGNVKEFAPVATIALPAVQFNPTTALAGNVYVADNTTQTLAPGYYGNVTINRGATLTLSAGDYYIRNLALGASGHMTFGGPTNVNVSDALDFGASSVVSGGGSTRGLHINAAQPGAVQIGNNAQLRGILTAPRANIIFGNGSRIDGAAYGSTVTLQPGAAANYHHDCDPILDPNCDGTPDCP